MSTRSQIDKRYTAGNQTPDSRTMPRAKGGAARLLIMSAILAAGTIISFEVWVTSTFGSLACFVAYVRGELIYVQNPAQHQDNVQYPQAATATYRLTNLGKHDITILGAKVGCTCMHIAGLPITIEPFRDAYLQATLSPSSRDAGRDIAQTAILYLDHDGPRPHLTLSAHFAQIEEYPRPAAGERKDGT